jgi:hypothetical protein
LPAVHEGGVRNVGPVGLCFEVGDEISP